MGLCKLIDTETVWIKDGGASLENCSILHYVCARTNVIHGSLIIVNMFKAKISTTGATLDKVFESCCVSKCEECLFMIDHVKVEYIISTLDTQHLNCKNQTAL